jgi:SAM-dependent methyltransferase
VKPKIICPTCGGDLKFTHQISCLSCNEDFPIYDRTPILLSKNNELFTKETSLKQSSSGFNIGFSAKISKYLPAITLNNFQDNALDSFIDSLNNNDKCLIIGAGHDHNLKLRLVHNGIKVTVTDVFASPIVDYVCDTTNLPFSDNQFDAVLIIAVLEHVVEPHVAVNEISRVLKYNGKVFSGIPFMQQVHMGCYDFTRYTLLGHRWLYKSFELLDLAPSSGSGSALLWSITSFFRSFTSSKISTLIIKSLVRVFLFWIKYFDFLQKNSDDFALGSYFVGLNKKNPVLGKQELIELYNKK